MIIKPIRSFIIFSVLILISKLSFALTYEAGVCAGMNYGSFEIEQGRSDSDSGNHVGLILHMQPSRSVRWSTGIEFTDSMSFGADAGGVGLSMDRTILFGSYERRWVATERIKPFLGVGLMYSQNDLNNRFQVDNEGFLQDEFGSATSNDASIQLLASQAFNVSERMTLGLRGRYEISDDAYNGFALSLSMAVEL